MITTDFVPGQPCWIDLGSPDVDAAARFYAGVFGWQARPMGGDGGEGGGDYQMFQLDGKAVGAVGKLTEPGARSAWMVYYDTRDIDATVKAAEEAGGTVRMPPSQVSEEGRLAQLTDPQGAQFAVWQSGSYGGIGVADGPGSLGWVELMTTDSAAAQRFYGAVFGWTGQDTELPGGGGTYTMVTPKGQPPERMFGGVMAMPEMFASGEVKPYWHPVFGTSDCDATVARVREGGGGVSMGPEDAEGVGRLAVCTDPAGAEFVVLTPASPSPDAPGA
ncbi:VOC family protein [Streptomyces genisteinicus]|uniref:VOC family protein n=1 Tax=Streptomyces genisteinicus TaxID=2768068 RepID=A0A7H0HT11_9ACTN|nr:VOC family protein [Streptomyces genisteinicus]QNP63677.1 VOC family protein [Streptomyces genisteinicus]